MSANDMMVIKTNWVNLLGVFLAVFLYAVILNLSNVNLSYNIFQSILAALISVCGYGMMFWVSFAISLIVVDILLILRNRNHLKQKLLIEWLLISAPFIYWTIEYREWIFAVAIIAFLCSQLFRERFIKANRKIS
jgi:heme exporter protein D